MYIWPSVVFRKYLSTKSRTFKFAFCTVVMIVLINLACIFLGLVHLLYGWVYKLIFFGIFIYSLVKGKKINELTIKKFKNLISGTYGVKSMFSDIFSFIGKKISACRNAFLGFMKGRWFEYIALGLLILFGLIYFSYGAFQDYSFGCGDVYTHTQWIYNLTKGTIFSSGIYPEGMHFFIYSETSLFGVPMYSAIIFTGCITVIFTLLAIYIFFRELFKWKYSPLLAVLLFLILGVDNYNAIYCEARMQWALPQEFGYPAMFLCAAYLIKYLRYSIIKKRSREEKKAESIKVKIPLKKEKINIIIPTCFKDDNLFIFVMSLAASIIIHFYATIMAFFLCLGVAVALIKHIFSRKLLPLIGGVVMGIIISILPFVICFVSGIRLQGSLYWAMSLFVTQEESAESQDQEEKPRESGEKDNDSENKIALEEPQGHFASLKVSGTKRFAEAGNGIIKKVFTYGNMLKNTGYLSMHGRTKGLLFFYGTLVSLAIGLVGLLVKLFLVKIKGKDNASVISFIPYIILGMIGIVVHLYNCSYVLGIPTIIELYRISFLALIVAIPTLVIPLDFVICLLNKYITPIVEKSIITGLAVITITVIKLTGNYHGFLMYQTTRYNSAVMVTKQIVETMPKDSFTIISSTDELYQILGHGFHEELITFINESEVVSYSIPTEYIFLFVEKNAIYRNQDHFFTGPGWLAEEKYSKYFTEKSSVGDDLLKQSISEDMANIFFGRFPSSISVYGTLWQRVLLNSKCFVWCQKFNAMYPNELHVYYEDEDFLVYYLRQNPRNLYELATMDPSVMVPPEAYDKPIWPKNYKDMMLDEEEEEEEDDSE